MEYKRRGEKLSYPQGLNDVLAIIIAEAPPAETRTRLDYRRAHQYLTDEGIADSTERKRMVKLCMKRVKRLLNRGASAPTSGEARASTRAMLPKAEATMTMKAVHAMAMIPAPGDMVYVDLNGYG